jgi:hypothetical protein
MSASRQSLARCPACDSRRDVETQAALRRTEDVWFEREASRYARGSPFYPLRDGMGRLACSGNARWFWACDECLRSGRAFAADVTKQYLGVGTPFAAYDEMGLANAKMATEYRARAKNRRRPA